MPTRRASLTFRPPLPLALQTSGYWEKVFDKVHPQAGRYVLGRHGVPDHWASAITSLLAPSLFR
eukprot:7334686-Alexandrium_andersonii.AAC.1